MSAPQRNSGRFARLVATGEFHRIVKLAGTCHTAWFVPFYSFAVVNRAE